MTLFPIPMLPEQRREHFIAYAGLLRERFRDGILAELQPLHQWVVWRNEVDDGKKKKRKSHQIDHDETNCI
jgi:hypothetical protein